MDIVWSKKSVFRIREIYNYYYSKSTKVASEIVSDIQQAGNSLHKFPYIAPAELILTKSNIIYRSLLVRNHYKILYFIDEQNQVIYIVTIWDCRKNPLDLIADI